MLPCAQSSSSIRSRNCQRKKWFSKQLEHWNNVLQAWMSLNVFLKHPTSRTRTRTRLSESGLPLIELCHTPGNKSFWFFSWEKFSDRLQGWLYREPRLREPLWLSYWPGVQRFLHRLGGWPGPENQWILWAGISRWQCHLRKSMFPAKPKDKRASFINRHTLGSTLVTSWQRSRSTGKRRVLKDWPRWGGNIRKASAGKWTQSPTSTWSPPGGSTSRWPSRGATCPSPASQSSSPTLLAIRGEGIFSLLGDFLIGCIQSKS